MSAYEGDRTSDSMVQDGSAESDTDERASLKANVAERVDAVKTAVAEAVSPAVHRVSNATQAAAGATGALVETVAAGVQEASQATKSGIANAASSFEAAKGTLIDAAGKAKNNFSDATERVKSQVADITSNVSGFGDAGQEQLVNSSNAAKSFARSAKDIFQANPMGLAIGSLAAGFLIGLTFPVSDLERDNVGPLGDQVVRNAKDAGTGALARAKTIFSAVNEALISPRA